MESNNNSKQYETDEVGSVSLVDTNNTSHKYSRLKHFLEHIAQYKLSKSTTDEFADCFKMVENAFHNCTKESPQNFMNFSYVLWRLAEVLGATEEVDEFSFKSSHALMEHDILWNKICDELVWNDNKVQLTNVVSDDELSGDKLPDDKLQHDKLPDDGLSDDGLADDELPDEINIPYESEEDNENTTSHEPSGKYTEIDLEEDAPIDGQQFVCLSFVSPEGVMNTKARAVKFRGAFPTYEKASAYAKKLQDKDPYFDIFVGEGGKWLLWDPDPLSVENVKYSNKKMQKLADSQNKRQQQKLNELVGRKKDLLKHKKTSHNRTVAEKIRSGVHEEGGGTMEYKKPVTNNTENEPTQKTRPVEKMSRLDAIKAKMRKKLAQKKKASESKKPDETDKLKEKLSEERDVQLNNINKRQEEVQSKKDAAQKIDANIEKIVKYMKDKNG